MATEWIITDYAIRSLKRFFEESGTFNKYRFLSPNFNFQGALAASGSKLIVVKNQSELQIAVFEDESLVTLFKLAFFSLWKDLEGKNIPPHP